MKERAVVWMKFLDSSFVCHGLHTDFEFADERIAKHHIITEDYDISEERAFSIRCEILTNSAGVRCSKCSEEKKRLDRKIGRRMLAKDKPLPPTANHQYMTREQILEKLEREKQQGLSEERQKERFQSQMRELEEEDHHDMVQIMSHVNKDDVPEDMLLFWDEQKKILQNESKCQYRWHPKLVHPMLQQGAQSLTTFDSFTFFSCRNLIQSEVSWKLSSTSDCLMSA